METTTPLEKVLEFAKFISANQEFPIEKIKDNGNGSFRVDSIYSIGDVTPLKDGIRREWCYHDRNEDKCLVVEIYNEDFQLIVSEER